MNNFLVTVEIGSGDHTFENICSLENNDLLAYKSAVVELRQWVNPDQFVLLEHAHNQYGKTVKMLSEQYRGTPVPNSTSTSLTLNFALLSFLSMSRLYLDHTATLLQQLNGDTKENEVVSFKAALTEEYDNHFAYRFGYKLRDYAQHCGLPVSGFEASKEITQNNGLKSKFEPYFSRDKLLSSFSGWKAVVKKDLKTQSKYFPVKDIVNEVMECFERIHRKVAQTAQPRLLSHVKAVQHIVAKDHNQRGNLHIMKIKNSNKKEGKMNMSLERVPVEYLSYLNRERLPL